MYTKIIAIATLVASTQAGLIPAGPAISAHGYALGPALSHGYGPALAAPALLAPAYLKAPIAAPALIKAAPAIDYVAYPRYEFKYGVADGHTGDQKSQSESRDGDVVKGQYSLVEPDGTIRTVTYTADDHNGFNAVVTRAGHASHPATPIALAPAKAILAAPAYGPALGHAIASPIGLGGYYKG